MPSTDRHSAAARAPWPVRLLHWYRLNQRALPWRNRPTPYRVWISEMMLQQTQVATALPYYRRFLRRFPTVHRLAEAPIQDVLKAWEGLGYYSRARHLHTAAGAIIRDLGGHLPGTASELRDLPGIGPYTAAAIASIAFGERVPVIDGNVLRVFCRFLALRTPVKSLGTRTRIEAFLSTHIPATAPGDFNQAIMELGALVCRPASPACPACPLAAECRAFHRGQTARFPLRSPGRTVPEIDVAVAVLRRNGRILIARRRADQMLGGLWEFPGGKIRPGETPQAALEREILEETGLTVGTLRPLCTIRHAYSHFRVRLHVFEGTPGPGRAQALSGDEVRWIRPSEFGRYPFPTANRRVIGQLTAPQSR